MTGLKDKVDALREITERHDALDRARKEARAEKEKLELELCEMFRDEMTTRADVDGLTVKAEFRPIYTINGGKLKAPEQREEVISLLEDLGFLDADKVKRYPAVEVADNSLQAAFRKLSVEQITDLQARGLVSVYDKPAVSIK